MNEREALQRIAAIENKLDGGDWDEIGEARLIARAALASAPAVRQAEPAWREQLDILVADYNAYVEGKERMPWSLFRTSLAAFFEVVTAPTPQATAPAGAEQAKPDGRLHADGYFTWNNGKRPDYIADKGLPCDFYLKPPSQAPAGVEAARQGQAREETYFQSRNEVQFWMGEYDVVLKNRAFAALIDLVDAARGAQKSHPQEGRMP